MSSTTDSITREIFLNVSRARVWRALADAAEFGTWFGITTNGQPFVAGQTICAKFTLRGYEHVSFQMLIDRIEPEHVFSYKWHPYAVDAEIDYSSEPMTTVTFELRDAPGGTHLTVTETGFDDLPDHRMPEAFRMNTQGWDEQIQNIQRHVTTH